MRIRYPFADKLSQLQQLQQFADIMYTYIYTHMHVYIYMYIYNTWRYRFFLPYRFTVNGLYPVQKGNLQY